MRRVSLAVVLCLLALPALAAGPNTGAPDAGGERGQHVLTAVPAGPMSILYAPSEDDDSAYRNAIAALTGGTVDYFDAREGTPSLDLMSSYDCVYTWTNFAYFDNVGFGDNLADYVDAGGNVVLGVFTAYTSGNFLDGRIMTSDYAPVNGGFNHFFSSSWSGDGVTSIYDNVNDFECTFRDILTLQGEGVQDGSYQDGEMAHAYNPGGQAFGRVVYSNGAGASQLACTGDWPQLVANTCMGVDAGCLLRLELPVRQVRAGSEPLRFRFAVHHRRPDTVSVPLVFWVEDANGRLITQRVTDPLRLEPGDRRGGEQHIMIPMGTKPGPYTLYMGVDQMMQGKVWAKQRFQVVE